MTIGQNICQLRKSKNMTQSKLAEKLGVTEQSVSKWENEKIKVEIYSQSCDYEALQKHVQQFFWDCYITMRLVNNIYSYTLYERGKRFRALKSR